MQLMDDMPTGCKINPAHSKMGPSRTRIWEEHVRHIHIYIYIYVYKYIYIYVYTQRGKKKCIYSHDTFNSLLDPRKQQVVKQEFQQVILLTSNKVPAPDAKSITSKCNDIITSTYYVTYIYVHKYITYKYTYTCMHKYICMLRIICAFIHG